MASTLLGGRGQDRITDKGHGTGALGPSDVRPDHIERIVDVSLDSDFETEAKSR
jgi:hypothetical protein